MKAVILLCTLMLASLGYGSTSGKTGSSGSSQGELTVTATVVSSIGLIIGPNGEQKYVVANAPDLQRELSSMMMGNAHPNAAPSASAQRAVHRQKRSGK